MKLQQLLCQKLEVPFHVVHTQIGKIVFEARKEHSPCSLCAKMRKGALNTAAMELGCNKVAYAHHMDEAPPSDQSGKSRGEKKIFSRNHKCPSIGLADD